MFVRRTLGSTIQRSALRTIAFGAPLPTVCRHLPPSSVQVMGLAQLTKHARLELVKIKQRARRAELDAKESAKLEALEEQSRGSKGNELEAADARKLYERNFRPLNTLLLHPIFKNAKSAAAVGIDEPTRVSTRTRGTAASIEELIGLVEAGGWKPLPVPSPLSLPIGRVTPSTLFGEGQMGAIEKVVSDFNESKNTSVEAVVVNASLTPTQQRNLESVVAVPVYDRTQLILHIFGQRARSSEAKLQVELATLQHKRSRLVRSQSAHYAQQRASGAGGGFLAGSGETQLETDHRVLSDRIRAVQARLVDVAAHRARQRATRKQNGIPIVAIVGYTNAGKSLLVNRLSGAELFTKDQLFATLDATTRKVKLPVSGRTVLVVDTVGFVSQLPHELVMSFRATLEEVVQADLLLHVRDIASTSSDAQRLDVHQVLAGLGVGTSGQKTSIPIIEVWNKIDKLSTADELTRRRVAYDAAREAEAASIQDTAQRIADGDASDGEAKSSKAGDAASYDTIKFHRRSQHELDRDWRGASKEIEQLTGNVAPVSAKTGAGLDELLATIDRVLVQTAEEAAEAGRNEPGAGVRGGGLSVLHEHRIVFDLSSPLHARGLEWLYARGLVLSRKDGIAEAGAEHLDAPASAEANSPAAKKPKSKSKAKKSKPATPAAAPIDSAAPSTPAVVDSSMLVTIHTNLDSSTQHQFYQLFQPYKLTAAAAAAAAAADAASSSQ